MTRIILSLFAFVLITGILSGCNRYEIEHVSIKTKPNKYEPGNSEFGHSHKKKKEHHDDD